MLTDVVTSATFRVLLPETILVLMATWIFVGGTFNRSPDATLYYAAIYTGDFSGSRAGDHYAALIVDDDGPSGPAPPEPTFLIPFRVI